MRTLMEKIQADTFSGLILDLAGLALEEVYTLIFECDMLLLPTNVRWKHLRSETSVISSLWWNAKRLWQTSSIKFNVWGFVCSLFRYYSITTSPSNSKQHVRAFHSWLGETPPCHTQLDVIWGPWFWYFLRITVCQSDRCGWM